jgi:hypothetical protein
VGGRGALSLHLAPANVIHQRAQPAEGLHGRGYTGRDLSVVGHITLHAEYLLAGLGGNLLGGGLSLLAVPVSDHYLGPGHGEGEGNGFTDVLAPPVMRAT